MTQKFLVPVSTACVPAKTVTPGSKGLMVGMSDRGANGTGASKKVTTKVNASGKPVVQTVVPAKKSSR